MVLRCALLARESSAINMQNVCEHVVGHRAMVGFHVTFLRTHC